MKKNLNQSNILICGTVRNCGRVLKHEINNLNESFKSAKSIKWLIIESDSYDNTLYILDNLKHKLNLDYISFGNLRHNLPLRTERIAFCRNAYLEKIQKNKKYSNVDYVVVADLDGVNNEITQSSVLSCWSSDVDWDACFANQKNYYDNIKKIKRTLRK